MATGSREYKICSTRVRTGTINIALTQYPFGNSTVRQIFHSYNRPGDYTVVSYPFLALLINPRKVSWTEYVPRILHVNDKRIKPIY